MFNQVRDDPGMLEIMSEYRLDAVAVGEETCYRIYKLRENSTDDFVEVKYNEFRSDFQNAWFSIGPREVEGGDCLYYSIHDQRLLDADGNEIQYEPAQHGDMIVDSIIHVLINTMGRYKLQQVDLREARTEEFKRKFVTRMFLM